MDQALQNEGLLCDGAQCVVHSSIGVPFICASANPEQFIATTPSSYQGNIPQCPVQPMQTSLQVAEMLVNNYIGEIDDVAVTSTPTGVIVDFEGEMLGFGGEMTVAVCLPYTCVHPKEVPLAPPLPGLMIDMTCPEGISLCKRVMEAPQLTKLGWGTQSDLASLLHQHTPRTLNIRPVNFVDIQLRFSTSPSKRLGLSRALRELAPHLKQLVDVPSKDSVIQWDHAYARNGKAMPFPLSNDHMHYALDDIHRIATVLQQGGGWTTPVGTTSPGGTVGSDVPLLQMACGYDDLIPEHRGVSATSVSLQACTEGPLCVPVNDLCSGAIVNLQPRHEWSAVCQVSTDEQSAIARDPWGLRWFYKQRKAYLRAQRNRAPLEEQRRRQVVLVRHIGNVFHQLGGIDNRSLHLSPYDARTLAQCWKEWRPQLHRVGVNI